MSFSATPCILCSGGCDLSCRLLANDLSHVYLHSFCHTLKSKAHGGEREKLNLNKDWVSDQEGHLAKQKEIGKKERKQHKETIANIKVKQNYVVQRRI